jgi:leader peptidase (prepilin peptidase) / N-methyltransferase
MVRAIVFGVFGLLVGSFLTVVTHRIPRGETVVAGRSKCPGCGATIRARDNVPLLSYLLLRGRCRACGARISPEYPLTELATALLAAGASLRFHSLLVAAMVAAFLAVLLALALIDARYRVLPNRILYPSVLLFALVIAVGDVADGGVDFATAAIGFAAFGGTLLVIAMVAPRGMGMGDVKLAFLIGLVLGSLALSLVAVAAGVAILAGGLGAIAALAAGRGRKSAIPFGPFLALGAAVAAFAGPQISQSYLRLFGA